MTCDWPGCEAEALCSSGNFGGKLVCSYHFHVTNGPHPVTGEAIESNGQRQEENLCSETRIPRR